MRSDSCSRPQKYLHTLERRTDPQYDVQSPERRERIKSSAVYHRQISKKRRGGAVVVLTESVEERTRWIGTVTPERRINY
jgi:hypothetical protein